MFLQNKYGLKKPEDFTMFESHKYPLIPYIILGYFSYSNLYPKLL